MTNRISQAVHSRSCSVIIQLSLVISFLRQPSVDSRNLSIERNCLQVRLRQFTFRYLTQAPALALYRLSIFAGFTLLGDCIHSQ
ncbi:hypothetical protein L596_003726 [Steinernema carpocapsae]|uniref:Uncharacterized protein n=1 Tax=Steinernema carpocapsae TaxID=34508 RepID=A0A4U8UV37_STECR|nr:hypothetical protein L596_003726 [Steinernema carpocapsae]